SSFRSSPCVAPRTPNASRSPALAPPAKPRLCTWGRSETAGRSPRRSSAGEAPPLATRSTGSDGETDPSRSKHAAARSAARNTTTTATGSLTGAQSTGARLECPPNMASADDIREQAREQWGNDPAGSLVVPDDELGSADSFREVEAYRYREQPWMHDTFHYERYRGQRVLEIGVGLGTDHMQFARAGAR